MQPAANRLHREYLIYPIFVFMLPNNINSPKSDVISTKSAAASKQKSRFVKHKSKLCNKARSVSDRRSQAQRIAAYPCTTAYCFKNCIISYPAPAVTLSYLIKPTGAFSRLAVG